MAYREATGVRSSLCPEAWYVLRIMYIMLNRHGTTNAVTGLLSVPRIVGDST
jgi:hypothetical protein